MVNRSPNLLKETKTITKSSNILGFVILERGASMIRKLFLLFIVIISTVTLVSGPEEELLIQQLKAEGHEPIFGPITIEQAKQIIRDW